MGRCAVRLAGAFACGVAGGLPTTPPFTAHAFSLRSASVLAFFSGVTLGGGIVSGSAGAVPLAFLLEVGMMGD